MYSLPGELTAYRLADYSAGSKIAVAALNFEAHLVERLYLTVDAIVMLIQNMSLERGWSKGPLALLDSEKMIRLQQLKNGALMNICRVQQSVVGTYYTRKQFPTASAYA